jgi:hypothetical protein
MIWVRSVLSRTRISAENSTFCAGVDALFGTESCAAAMSETVSVNVSPRINLRILNLSLTLERAASIDARENELRRTSLTALVRVTNS